MLENTNLYFLYLLFLNINEKSKLKLLKYNKNLQDKLGIKLIHYKTFSGKYIIYQTNGKVKEFNVYNDKTIFEGEYLNGKRNGKGKEYYSSGKVKFKGDYYEDKRWNGII